jgi:hypothetical protein
MDHRDELIHSPNILTTRIGFTWNAERGDFTPKVELMRVEPGGGHRGSEPDSPASKNRFIITDTHRFAWAIITEGGRHG